MKVAVIGAGGVGGFFGGRLAEAGEEVHFLARGAHLAALQTRGLEVTSPRGSFSLEVSATDDPRTVGPVDAVLFTVKAQDTEVAARQAGPLLAPHTAVVSLQNGVDNETVLARILGASFVLGGVAYIEATVAAPGVIRHSSPFARLVFGELNGEVSARAERLLAAFQRAGVEAELSRDIVRVLWTKWLFICAFSGVTALTRKPISEVLGDPDTAALYRRTLEEIAALAKAKGVALPESIVRERLEFSRTLHPEMRSSLQQDLAKGRTLELAALNGYASRLGRELGVPTPVNDTIYAALKLYEGGRGGAAHTGGAR